MEYISTQNDRFCVPILPYTLTTRPKPPQIYPPLSEEEREILIEALILLWEKNKKGYLEKRTYWVTMLSHPKSP